MIETGFWKDRRVFVTGHTGFKGAWMCLLLDHVGARVTGFALDPPTDPSLFRLCQLDTLVDCHAGDVRDPEALQEALRACRPEIVFHMAAQSLVRPSYQNPVETYETNVMGTIRLLEAVRRQPEVRAVVNVTTDKCYENREWLWGYREDERFGGDDPYSSSKACAELVTHAYRKSFFASGPIQLASARGGNVIGGGDWSSDRLIPDCLSGILAGEKILIRNPAAIRPWQFVLEPLTGYLRLAEKLCEPGDTFAGGWNFGPQDADAQSVEWVVNALCSKWGHTAGYEVAPGPHPHEAGTLKLDCTKARKLLGWSTRLDIDRALDRIVDFARAYDDGGDLRHECRRQIEEYLGQVPS